MLLGCCLGAASVVLEWRLGGAWVLLGCCFGAVWVLLGCCLRAALLLERIPQTELCTARTN
eukprot:1357129-Lingulodinium_polyedra.AAC.1